MGSCWNSRKTEIGVQATILNIWPRYVGPNFELKCPETEIFAEDSPV